MTNKETLIDWLACTIYAIVLGAMFAYGALGGFL